MKSIERMRLAKLGQAHPVKVINNKTGEIKIFTSIRQAAKFIGIINTYLAECLRKNKFYKGRGYYITRI
jgi:phage antirepressor YoqD-like protein